MILKKQAIARPDGEEPSFEGCHSYTSAAVLNIVRRVVGEPAKLHAPLIGEKEFEAVGKCVAAGQVTHGPHLAEFEGFVARTAGTKHAVAVSSGTAALHLALLAAGVARGDKVVVPSFTFVATANAVIYCGAVPQFVDCDEYGGLDPGKLDAWLKSHKVKAVICVHCFGSCCDMGELASICERRGVVLIEDAAQALGSYFNGKRAGSFGLLAAFSFNGNKIITTGGGGAVVTDNHALAKRVRVLATVAKEDMPGEFWHVETGFNYRMPNMNAALGCAQAGNFHEIRGRKQILAKRYHAAFTGCPFAQVIEPRDGSNCWLNVIELADPSKRKETASALDLHRYECRLGWTPLHYLPMYRDAERGDMSATEHIAGRIINLPSGPGIIP